MEKVTGIGGVFFRCKDTAATYAWYREHLGIDANAWGKTFMWKDDDAVDGFTQWSAFAADTDYFAPSASDVMINYRVRDLAAMLAQLKEKGVEQVGDVQEEEYGKFGWILDIDGRKVELWEPPATLPSDPEE